MIRFAIIAALIAAPAIAATVEDPDSPRFADGLRVLGMRGEVKIERVLEVEGIDREPLYLAHSPDRDAFFREGEDMCMASGKLGHFVACDARLAQAAARTIGEPIRGAGIAIWPRTVTRRDTSGAGGWSGVVMGGSGSGLPPHVPGPPPETVPPAPVPLPSAAWMLIAALLTMTLWQRAMGMRR